MKTSPIMKEVSGWFDERSEVYASVSGNEEFLAAIEKAGALMRGSLKKGGKILIFGNGGSAAEAQHFAAELVGRFEKNRQALPAIALTTDSSILTAQANDDSFSTIFSRQIEALGKKGDVVLGMTTSDVSPKDGHSLNILNGFKAARKKGLKTIGLFSLKTKSLLSVVDVPIKVPHDKTPVIQEMHLSIIHFLCRQIEKDWA